MGSLQGEVLRSKFIRAFASIAETRFSVEQFASNITG